MPGLVESLRTWQEVKLDCWTWISAPPEEEVWSFLSSSAVNISAATHSEFSDYEVFTAETENRRDS